MFVCVCVCVCVCACTCMTFEGHHQTRVVAMAQDQQLRIRSNCAHIKAHTHKYTLAHWHIYVRRTAPYLSFRPSWNLAATFLGRSCIFAWGSDVLVAFVPAKSVYSIDSYIFKKIYCWVLCASKTASIVNMWLWLPRTRRCRRP